MMGWLLALLLGMVALALLGVGINFVQNLESENRFVESQLHAAKMYDDAIEARVEGMRRFRHDVTGLLQAIEFASYAAEGKAARPEGEGEEGALGAIQGAFPLVDAVVQLKRRQCAQSHIAFSCEVDVGFARCAQEAGVDEADLCAIVQNLLDNAYEASLEVDLAAGRVIDVRLGAPESGLAVEVRNRTAGSAAPTFQTTKAEPEQHGVGLRVVDKVARKYGGVVRRDFDSDARMLTVRVELGGGVRSSA